MEGASTGVSVSVRPALVEREQELARLRALLAPCPTGILAIVEGPAGIGKTALLAAAADLAQTAGYVVLQARGGELERDFSFGLVRQALLPALGRPPRAALLAGPARLASPALGLEPGGHRPAGDALGSALHGLHWLCADLAEQRPLLVVLDDVQWGDPESVRWAAYTARRLHDLPVVMLAGLRSPAPDIGSGLLTALRAEAGETIALGPVSEAGSATLVQRAYATSVPDPRFTAACHTASGGNPFFLRELLAGAAAAGLPPTAASAPQVLTIGPRQLAAAALERIADADRAAPRLARAAAILGTDAPPAIAARLAGLDAAAAAGAADALRAAGLMLDSTALEFTHPVLRNAVLEDLPLGERDVLHRRAAELLTEVNAASDHIATHLLATQPAGDPATARTLRAAAAQAAAAGAPSAAATYLQRAVAEPPPEAELADTVLALARVEQLVSPAAAPARYQAALAATTDPGAHARIVIELCDALAHNGRVADARPALDAVLAARTDRTGTVARLLELRRAELDPEQWWPWLEDELARLGDGTDTAFTLELRLRRVGGVPEGHVGVVPKERLVDDMQRVLGGHDLLPHKGPADLASFAFTFFDCDRPDLGREMLDAAVADLAARGSEASRLRLLSVQAGLAAHLGDRETLMREQVELAGELGLDGPLRILRAWLAHLLIDRGQLDEAAAQLAASGLPPDLGEAPEPALWFWSSEAQIQLQVRGSLRLARGEVEAGARDLLDAARRSAPRGSTWALHARAAAALALLGRKDEARELVAVDAAWAREFGARRPLARVAHAQGLIEGGAPGVALLREACALLRQVSTARGGRDLAAAQVDLGSMLRRQGQRTEARAELRTALQVAEAIGAGLLGARARDELRASGGRLRRGPELLSGVAALTPSELRVAQLAADGRTNREIGHVLFLAPKTVEMHLGRAYRKLDISGRDQLADALAAEPDALPAG